MRRSSFRMLFEAKLPISTVVTSGRSDCSAISIRNPDDALVTAMPNCRTSCGNRDSTRLRRSWTWPRATSRSRSEEHTSELQSLMRISYAVFCLKKKQHNQTYQNITKKTNTNTHIQYLQI